MDNYVGKVVKITGKDGLNLDFVFTGIVYEQKILRDRPAVSLILTNGAVKPDLRLVSDYKITSTKIEPELRVALKDAFRAKVKLMAFEQKYLAEKEVLENSLSKTLLSVKDNSNEMTTREFMDAVEKLFTEKYPSSGNWNLKYFTIASYSSNEITMKQVQEVEKYANPEKFSFLYREYDDAMFIEENAPGYKEFCERNAPGIIPELGKHCTTEVFATIGDKNWLSVNRAYTFPIKYGTTKKSLEDIKERILGMKPSLESRIKSAESSRERASAEKVKSLTLER